MERRSFRKLSPALPVGAVTASLVLREDGKKDVSLDVVGAEDATGRRARALDAATHDPGNGRRLRAHVESLWPELKAMVLSDGLKLDGVIRTTKP